jgi:hypothetical protein
MPTWSNSMTMTPASGWDSVALTTLAMSAGSSDSTTAIITT